MLNIHHWGSRKKVLAEFKKLRTTKANYLRPYPNPPVLFKECWHKELTNKDSRTTKWFNIGDKDFKVFFYVITDTRFCNVLPRCAQFLHTGNLESFHAVKIQYLPKAVAFTMIASIILTMLAIMHHNFGQKSVIKSYNVQKWSRAEKKWLLAKKTMRDTVSFKRDILSQVSENITAGTVMTYDLSNYIRQPVPKTYHGTPKPSMESLLSGKRSRL